MESQVVTGTQATAAEPELRSLKGELVLLIAEQARRVPSAVIGSAAVIAWLVSSQMPPQLPLLWFLAVVIGTAIHTPLVVRLPRDTHRGDDRKLTVAAISFGIHAAVLTSILFAFPHVTVTVNAVLTIYCIGLAAATLHATAGFPRVFIPYTLATLGPVIAVWVLPLHPEVNLVERLTMAGLSVAYLITLWGHAKGAFKVFSDAHHMREERLVLNRQLREALTHAESANTAKTRFLASASHDLRQPIHALTLFSGSLSLRPLDARTAAIAEQIEKATTVLGTQLDALLDISRLDAGVIESNLSPIDLRQMLALLLQEFQPQVEQKQLGLRLQCEPGVLAKSDAGLLLRVLRNLISNAVKYTEHGSVTVAVEVVAGRCRVAVSDTGAGIPEAEQQKVFEEFYQLENPERDRSKGLGLGLAIVRRLSALLDIELSLHSVPGQGSCFTLWLALAAEPLPLPPPPQPGSPSQGIRVLVVDDEEAIRLGMTILLEEMGFAVQVAASTETALALAARFAPSIVLADFRLHGDDNGMRTIETLRQQTPRLPALLISGDTAPDRLQKAHAAGIGLLHKPVNRAQLQEAILKAVQP